MMSDAPERIWAGNWLADVGETLAWDIGEWRDEPWQTVNTVEYVIKEDYDALAAKLADAERVARHESDIAQQAIDQMRAAEAALPAVYRLALEDAYWSREVTPTPTAAELMARIQTGEKK